MSESFDPYHHWLGIGADEQPADHYRLLGIKQFEDRADVIANAADRQMTYVRTFQKGKYAQHSQRLLDELATARLCLLDEETKAEYDNELRPATPGEKDSQPSKVDEPSVAAKPPSPVSNQQRGEAHEGGQQETPLAGPAPAVQPRRKPPKLPPKLPVKGPEEQVAAKTEPEAELDSIWDSIELAPHESDVANRPAGFSSADLLAQYTDTDRHAAAALSTAPARKKTSRPWGAALLGVIEKLGINGDRLPFEPGRIGSVIGVVVLSLGGVFASVLVFGSLYLIYWMTSQAENERLSAERLEQIGAGFEKLRLANTRSTTVPEPYVENSFVSAPPLPRTSWRVELLNHLGFSELEREYNKKQPWDSEENKRLIGKIPEVYQTPGAGVEFGKTNYVTVRHPNSVFPPPTGDPADRVSWGEVRGKNTIMVIEVSDEKAVYWTQPDDYDLDISRPRDGVFGLRNEGALALMGSLYACKIPDSISDVELNKLFDRAIDVGDFDAEVKRVLESDD